MKTKTQSNTRYRAALRDRKKVADILKRTLKISEYDYNELAFEYGMKLLEVFWGDFTKQEHVRKKYDEVKASPDYWRWWMNQRSIAEVAFCYEVQEVYKIDVKENGNEGARRVLKEYYTDMYEELIHNDEMHERFRKYIIKRY